MPSLGDNLNANQADSDELTQEPIDRAVTKLDRAGTKLTTVDMNAMGSGLATFDIEPIRVNDPV